MNLFLIWFRTGMNSGSALFQLPLGAVSIAVLFLIGGCSVLPGMFVLPGKAPVENSGEVSSESVDYKLFNITPQLVQQLNEEIAATESQSLASIAVLPKSESFPYRLGPQDVLRIFVWGNPDLTPVTTTVSTTTAASTPAGRTIDDDGNIFFPLAGTVRASGYTVSQFRKILSNKLSKYIKDPQVEVDVAGFRSQKVFVTGEVRNPGIVAITDQPLHLIDALGIAGGPTNNSDLYGVVFTRGQTTTTINVDKLYYSGSIATNILLQTGDIISVPDRSLRKVFVLGEVGNQAGVNQSRSYVMRRGRMTLTEVLSDAGGANPFSSAANEIYVLRALNNGKPVVYLLNSSQPQALVLAERFPIQPRDVIFVNPTGPTMIGRFIGQFLPVLQSVNAAATTPF